MPGRHCCLRGNRRARCPGLKIAQWLLSAPDWLDWRRRVDLQNFAPGTVSWFWMLVQLVRALLAVILAIRSTHLCPTQ